MSTNTCPAAPLWRRFAALVYDSLLLLALTFAYAALATFIDVQVDGPVVHEYQPMFEGPWLLLGWILLIMFFYSWFWHKSGQTLGMRTWRIQLVSAAEGRPLPGWKQCIIRSLGGAASLSLLGLGYWYALFDPQRRCWHDRLSGTEVIVLPKPGKKGS